MITGFVIPRKKRKIEDGGQSSSPLSSLQHSSQQSIDRGQSSPLSSLQHSSLQSNKNSSPSDAARRKQYFNILNMQGHSEAQSLGEASLFIQLEGTTTLLAAKLKKRCIRSSDCIKGRTYMDSTSFSNATNKKRCPLVVFSQNGKNNFQRGYLLHLGVRKTVIIGLKPDNTFIEDPVVFYPMKTDKDLCIIYINEVDETMDSKEDGFLCSKTTGPDYIEMNELPKRWRDMKIELSNKQRLIRIPDLTNYKREVTPTPFKHDTLTTKKNVYLIDDNEELPKSSDLGRQKEDWKNHYAFTSPDSEEEGTVYMVHASKAIQLIEIGEMDRVEYLRELKKRATYTIKCNVLDIDEEKSLALTMNSTHTTTDGGGGGKQLFQYEGDVVAFYKQQPPLEIMDVEGIRYLFHTVLNGTSTGRKCANNIGLFFNKGITTSERPKLDPRKDTETKMDSERWNGNMNQTFAPLLFDIIEQLAEYSTKASNMIDPVTTYSFRKIYEELCTTMEGKEVLKNNLNTSFGLSSLQILTFPSEDGVNFANTGHIDRNDLNVKAFHITMTNKLLEELSDWRWYNDQSRKKNRVPNIEDRRKRYIKSLFYQLRNGMKDQVEEQHQDEYKLQYETETTCVYNPLYLGNQKRQVFCGFLYPKNATLVRFPLNRRTIQRWKSNSLFHQTPVSFTYDDEKVYFKDENLIVLAWGAGTGTKRRDFIAEQNINYNGPIRGTRHICQILRSNNAPRGAFVAARETFHYHQRCITDFFSSYYPDDEPL